MKTWIRVSAGLAVGIMLWSGIALAQDKPADCDKAGGREKVEGRITKLDLDQGKVTVVEGDGKTHVFEASRETLQDFKVGDKITAKLRLAPSCSK